MIAVCVQNQLWVAGGWTGPHSSANAVSAVEYLDLSQANPSWIPGPNMRERRLDVQMIETASSKRKPPTSVCPDMHRMRSGRLYVFGGWRDNVQLSTVEYLDLSLASPSWQYATSMPVGRNVYTAILVRASTRTYLLSGVTSSDAWPWTSIVSVDHSTVMGSWRTETAQLSAVRTGPAAVLINDSAYLLGGCGVWNWNTIGQSDSEVFNVASRTLSSGPSLPDGPRCGGSAVSTDNGESARPNAVRPAGSPIDI
jgi:hypothetical protein